MLATTGAFSGMSASDIPTVRAFYEDTLGISVVDAGMGAITLHLDPGGVVVVHIYPKPDHVPAAYTALNFMVNDIDAAVDELVEAGVTITRYDGMPQDDKGIMRGKSVGMGPDIAWFTDPAGNILSVLCE